MTITLGMLLCKPGQGGRPAPLGSPVFMKLATYCCRSSDTGRVTGKLRVEGAALRKAEVYDCESGTYLPAGAKTKTDGQQTIVEGVKLEPNGDVVLVCH